MAHMFHFVMRSLAKSLLTISVTINMAVVLVCCHIVLPYSLTHTYSIVAFTYPYVRDASGYEISDSSVAIFNVTCYDDYDGSTYCDTTDVDIIDGSGCDGYGGQAIVSCGE